MPDRTVRAKVAKILSFMMRRLLPGFLLGQVWAPERQPLDGYFAAGGKTACTVPLWVSSMGSRCRLICWRIMAVCALKAVIVIRVNGRLGSMTYGAF